MDPTRTPSVEKLRNGRYRIQTPIELLFPSPRLCSSKRGLLAGSRMQDGAQTKEHE